MAKKDSAHLKGSTGVDSIPFDKPPGVSVVIPAYNYARYLGEAIDSVLSQTYPEFEIIVVDDGSTDETAEVARGYGEKIRYIHQENAGLSAARNTGIRAARYSLVAFLDADDLWKPEFLRSAMQCFAGLPKTFGMVTCRGVRFSAENGDWLPRRLWLPGPREITVHDLIFRNRFPPASVVGRREAFETAGLFDTSLTSTEDRDMWMRVAARWRIFQQDQVLVRIRQHQVQMSRNATRMRRNMLQVLRKAFLSALAPRWNLVFWAQVHAFCFYQTACMFHDNQDRFRATRDGILSLLVWPLPMNAMALNEVKFFRIRNLRRFTMHG